MAIRIVLADFTDTKVTLKTGDLMDDTLFNFAQLETAGLSVSAASPAAGLLTAALRFRERRNRINPDKWSGDLSGALLAASGTV